MKHISYLVLALLAGCLIGSNVQAQTQSTQDGAAKPTTGSAKATTASAKPASKPATDKQASSKSAATGTPAKADSSKKANAKSKANVKNAKSKNDKSKDSKNQKGTAGKVPDPKSIGGESQSIVQVANLIYAGVKSSQCFSDHFLVAAEKDSAVSTSRRFHAVKADANEIFNFPLVIMTGEGSFTLTEPERANMRRYIERGGFLLASAGCSSADWNQAFRREMKKLFPKKPMTKIDMKHPVFKTVYEINKLTAAHGTPRPLEGITVKGRLGVVYSQDGLNDTSHAQGCCCCGGNEITNCIQINVNILAYALVY